jgi:glycosyltransferase involved in cell wall biosynthesis
LLNHPEKRQRLGENARLRAEERFNLEQIALENIEFYQSLI